MPWQTGLVSLCRSGDAENAGALGGLVDSTAKVTQPPRSYEVQFGTQLQHTATFHSFALAMAFAEGWQVGRKSAGFSHDFRIVNLDRVDEFSPGLSQEEKEQIEGL